MSAGRATYYNKSLEPLTGKGSSGDGSSGDGWAADAAVNYDWKILQGKAHIETLLNVERGRISYDEPLTGQFTFSEIAASVHYARF